MDSILLKNVNIDALRLLLGRSESLNSILHIELTNDEISSIAVDSSSAMWKSWNTSSHGIYESKFEGSKKIVIANASFFINTVLSFFSGTSDTEIKFEFLKENECSDIKIKTKQYKINGSEQELIIRFPPGRLELNAGNQLDEDEYQKLFAFNVENDPKFTFTKYILSSLTKLIKVNGQSDEKTDYLEFVSDGEYLTIKDSSIELTNVMKIENGPKSQFSFKINKVYMPLIDSENHSAYYSTNSEGLQRLILQSTNPQIESVISIILMDKLSDIEGSDLMNDGKVDWSDFN